MRRLLASALALTSAGCPQFLGDFTTGDAGADGRSTDGGGAGDTGAGLDGTVDTASADTASADAMRDSANANGDAPAHDAMVEANAPTAEPPTNGLVGYWTFDNAGTTVDDSSGSGNNGTVTGATQIPGKLGLAYQFDGGGCVTIPDSPSLDMTGATGLTMMAWVTVLPCPQPDSSYVNRGTVLGKNGEYEHSVSCGSSPSYQEAIATAQNKDWADQPGSPISTATWHHVATTWNAQTVYQYVDGVEVASRALAGGTLSPTAVFGVASGIGIGCGNVDAMGSTGSDAYWFVGSIDEVALYNRALSASEIQGYYAATK